MDQEKKVKVAIYEKKYGVTRDRGESYYRKKRGLVVWGGSSRRKTICQSPTSKE